MFLYTVFHKYKKKDVQANK
uniref:Uncharacterized protein n=1 Tax=Arundo donax TaxID=35708 RepID=A0A0A9BD92_ARUDO